MSFQSAMRNTQANQRYRQNDSQIMNMDREYRDQQLDYEHKVNQRNKGVELFGSAVSLLDTAGKNMTQMGKNIDLAKSQGLEHGGYGFGKGGMLNPFKEGGFGSTWAKEGGPQMTHDDLYKAKQTMDWSKAYMGNDSFNFDTSTEISMSDNPGQSLLGRYNQYKQDQIINAQNDRNRSTMGNVTNNYYSGNPVEEKISKPNVPSSSSTAGGPPNPGELGKMFSMGEIGKEEYDYYMQEWNNSGGQP